MTAFRRRAVWMPLLAVALVVGGLIAARSVIGEREATLAGRLEAIQRLKSATEQSRAILAAPQADRAAALGSDFLPGAQDAVVAAELQNRLRALALDNRVEFNSANVLPPRELDGIGYLTLRVQMRGELRDIQAVLQAIEAGTPLLFVDRVAMRVDTWPMKSADPTRDGAPALVAEIDVGGARQPLARPAGTSGEGRAAPEVPWLSNSSGRRS